MNSAATRTTSEFNSFDRRQTRPLPSRQTRATLSKARRLAWLMDKSIGIPNTKLRIGADGLIGLIPGIGDIAGAAVSSYIIVLGAKAGASTSVILSMVLNVLVDTVIGKIPVLGDLFDFGWKANSRNVALLEDHLHDPKATRRASALRVVLALSMVSAVMIGTIWLAFWVISSLLSAIF